MLSLNCSHPSLFFKSTRRHATEIHVQKPKATIFRPDSTSGSLGLRESRKWAFRRSISRPKSVKTEAETEQSTHPSGEEASISNDGGSPSGSFLSILCPLLKFFGGGDPSQERNEVLEVATSSLSSLARLPWGTRSLLGSSQHHECRDGPPVCLQLYEFEACPFCRRVREAMTELDLTVEVYPCPKGSVRHRQMVQKLGGKEQFPFLVDPNTGISMYESGDIVKYLFQQYGRGRNPSFGLMESTLFTGWMPTLLRAGRGMTLWNKASSEPPPERLELFSYENNPYARIVREALCELELPYLLHNVGEGSSKTESLVQISGSKEVPYLVDTNTGTKLGNYEKILSYLFHGAFPTLTNQAGNWKKIQSSKRNAMVPPFLPPFFATFFSAVQSENRMAETWEAPNLNSELPTV